MMIEVESAPNIAFIKYWGKKEFTQDKDRNLALNPSLSMTLSKAKTLVRAQYSEETEVFIQEQKARSQDFEKIQNHIQRICKDLGQEEIKLRIESKNNFPMGAGIASSASAFSALTVAILGCLLKDEILLTRFLEQEEEKVTEWARRGSGSASRSLEGPYVKWEGRSARKFPCSWKLYDTLILFSSEEKKVSSSQGHLAAATSPHLKKRLDALPERMRLLEVALKKQSIHDFGTLLEKESDEMHAIMESSIPPIQYRLPETLRFLKALKEIPQRDFYYTLDAGPNVHLISERPIRAELEAIFKKLNIAPKIWEDEAGAGPRWKYIS